METKLLSRIRFLQICVFGLFILNVIFVINCFFPLLHQQRFKIINMIHLGKRLCIILNNIFLIAYILFLQAWNQYLPFDQARTKLEKAISLDPGYADAYALLAG